jgi:hypothetical protein
MAEKLPGRKWKSRPAGAGIISVADGLEQSLPDDPAILIGWTSTLEIRQTASPRVSPKSALRGYPLAASPTRWALSAAASRASVFRLDASHLAPPPGSSSWLLLLTAPPRCPPRCSTSLLHLAARPYRAEFPPGGLGATARSPAALLVGDQVRNPPRLNSPLGSLRISAPGLFRRSTRAGKDRLSACFTTESNRPSIHSVPLCTTPSWRTN